jgi:hypothetical protein
LELSSNKAKERVIGPCDFVHDDDTECRAFGMQHHLLEEVAAVARWHKKETCPTCPAIIAVREYKAMQEELVVHRVKQEIIDLNFDE